MPLNDRLAGVLSALRQYAFEDGVISVFWDPIILGKFDSSVLSRVAFTDSSKALFGCRELDESWDDFYVRASSSNQLFAIKTHQYPRDNQKAIYVVRDGRQALVSYRKFHQDFLGDRQSSLLQLISGLDYYGGWSAHYEAWAINRPDTLVVHFEDLARGENFTIEALAEHLGYTGKLRPWNNPFHQLNQDNPNFFRKGKLAWEKDDLWNDFFDEVFFQIHGHLIERLGYADKLTVAHNMMQMPMEIQELVALV